MQLLFLPLVLKWSDARDLCFPTATVSTSSTPTPTGSAQQGQPPVAPPPPQYSYQEINVASLAGLAPHIQINGQVSEALTIVKCAVKIIKHYPGRCRAINLFSFFHSHSKAF